MEYKFKIGDKVRIREDSEYIYQSKAKGEIIELIKIGKYIYQVQFEDSFNNQYRNEDLEFVDHFKEIKDKLIKTLTTPNLYIKTNNKERIMLIKILELLDIKIYNYTEDVIKNLQNNNYDIVFVYLNNNKIKFSISSPSNNIIEFEDIIKDFKEYKQNE